MTNLFQAAQGQRNFLERLGAKIPGFRGFQDRELRRDVDKLQREHLAAELGRLKAALQSRARDYTDAGKIAALAAFGRIDRQLDGLAQTIRFSDYGASGLFDAVKIGEPQLAQVYEFDLSVLDDLAAVDAGVAAVPAPAEDPGPLNTSLDKLRELVQALDAKWQSRRQVITNAVQGAQSA